MEVTAQMRPTCGFAQTRHAICFRRVELGIALVTVRLQDAERVSQMAENVLFLPVWRKPIDSAGWCGPRPWPLIAHIGPDPALLDTLTKALVTQAAIQHPDRRVVRMQQIAGHDVGLNPLDQRLQGLHGPPAPAD